MTACLLALLVGGGVQAQAERALELLRGLESRTSAGAQPLETFDYTLHYTIYSDNTAKAAENWLRFAVDTEARLLYTDRFIGRTPNFKLTYEDGRATAYNLRGGETFTPPEDRVAPFKRWFDQVANPDIRDRDLRSARYNGRKRYGEVALYRGDERYTGVVEGEEVVVTAAIPDFLGTSLGRVPVKLIFGEQGEHIASVYSVEGEVQLVVYNDPRDLAPLPRYLNAHLYKLGAEKLSLEARTRLTEVSVNQPIDWTLFDPASRPTTRN